MEKNNNFIFYIRLFKYDIPVKYMYDLFSFVGRKSVKISFKKDYIMFFKYDFFRGCAQFVNVFAFLLVEHELVRYNISWLSN